MKVRGLGCRILRFRVSGLGLKVQDDDLGLSISH